MLKLSLKKKKKTNAILYCLLVLQGYAELKRKAFIKLSFL